MKKVLVAFILGLIAATGIGYAITVNPASAVTADSANTALTIPYRDANGAFSMGALTATSVSVSAQAGPVNFQAKTKAQFDAIVPAIGDMYRCSDCTEKLVCIATGTAISTSSNGRDWAPAPRLAACRRRALSMRMRRMASAAAPKKCARF